MKLFLLDYFKRSSRKDIFTVWKTFYSFLRSASRTTLQLADWSALNQLVTLLVLDLRVRLLQTQEQSSSSTWCTVFIFGTIADSLIFCLDVKLGCQGTFISLFPTLIGSCQNCFSNLVAFWSFIHAIKSLMLNNKLMSTAVKARLRCQCSWRIHTTMPLIIAGYFSLFCLLVW